MPRKRSVVPSYIHLKKRGLARVRHNGRDFYLGQYDSKESKRLYALLLRWLQATDDPPANWQDLDPDKFVAQQPAELKHVGLTVVELLAKYLAFATTYYATSNERDMIKYALRPVRELFGMTPAADFGPLRLSQARDAMIAAGWKRSGNNNY